MFSSVFWKSAAERAGKTFLQTYFAGALAGGVFDVFAFEWGGPQLGIALGATGLSVVTSLLSTLKGDEESPAFESTGDHAA